MKRYRVTVFFEDKTVYLSAKNEADAKKKAYKKFENKPASKMIKKSETLVYGGF